MTRWTTILASALVVAAATVAIIVAVFLVSWRFAMTGHESELRREAVHLLEHAEAIYDDAVAALRSLESNRNEPCSPEHIKLMMETSLRSLYISNVGYAWGGYSTCSAYGVVDTPIPSFRIDVVQPDGYQIFVNWRGPVRGRGPLMIVKSPSYGVMIAQRLFYERLSHEPPLTFTFRTLNGIALDGGAETMPQSDTGDEIRVVMTSRAWILEAAAPALGFLAYLRSELPVLVPLAVALVLLLGSAAVWFVAQATSGRAVIRRALQLRQFIVHYQPIVELATNRCVAAEALVRLRASDGVLVSPDAFIPFFEETGEIGMLTDQVLEIVVREMGPLLCSNRSLHISVNVSASDIVSGRILGTLERVLANSGIEQQQVWLEMTERGFMNIEGARPTLDELNRRGHRIAIDDFGTGYSGLQYLAQLPVQVLKIDKSFVETVGTAAPTSRVTEQIIAMARELNLTIVAEGVETERQAAFLRGQRVDYAQGWLFSRAIPADEFLAFYRTNPPRVTSAAAAE